MAKQDVSMVEKDVSMATKDSMDLWFISNGCEDHLTTVDTSIHEEHRSQCTHCHKLGHTRDRCYQLHADLPVLLIWLSLLIIQRVQVLSQGVHPHLRGSFLRPTNMRSTFVSLKQPNLPPLLLLPIPIMSLLALHVHLHLGSLILESLIISLVIKTFFLLLPFRLLYPLLP